MMPKNPQAKIQSWSELVIKSVDDEKRTLNGIASTPQTDRDGDIVEPSGAKYKTPFPLLSQHDHTKPIGMVNEMKVTQKGLEIEASIPQDSGLGYVDMAWRQIKAGLLRGLSIGFRPLEYEPMENGLGWKFLKYEIFELSAVTIPANAGASITSIKKFDLNPLDLEEQLFNIQASRVDVEAKALAAIEKSNAILAKFKD